MSVPIGVNLKVYGNPLTIRKRQATVFGPLLSDKRYFIHNASFVNTKRALIERVFRIRKAEGYKEPLYPTFRFDKQLLAERTTLLRHPKLNPFTSEQVLPLWKGSKLAVYTRAYNSLLVKPLTRWDATLKAFVKCEKIDSVKGDPAPRLIQPRSPRYNLSLARFLKPHEHTFYKRIDQMFDTDMLGDKTVFKGLNSKQCAEHLLLKTSRYSNPVFIGLDASRFDQHVSDLALRWEHDIYINSFNYGQRELSRLLEQQIHNTGVSYFNGGKIKYSVTGRRMSGDMNTSLGNCLLMSSMVHAYCRQHNIPKFSLANNGDDCLVIVEKEHLKCLANIPTWFSKMGFDMKVEKPVYDLRKASFCQVNVVTSPGYNICVRNPYVVASKDLHSTLAVQNHKQYLQILSASGVCGLNSSRGIPILESFYRSFPVCSVYDTKILEELRRWETYGIVGGSKDIPITPEMRHSFWIAFGCTPDQQEIIEGLYKRIQFGTDKGDVNCFPYLRYLININ